MGFRVGGESGVETLRKPSTGLKRNPQPEPRHCEDVETLRKPSTGLKPDCSVVSSEVSPGRDTQKTQHGIETRNLPKTARPRHEVETLRKPSTGLKQLDSWHVGICKIVETLRKPSTGLKQHEHRVGFTGVWVSRHSENPARD